MKIFISLPNIFLCQRTVSPICRLGRGLFCLCSISLLWMSLNHSVPTLFGERFDVKVNFLIHGSPTEKNLFLAIRSPLESVQEGVFICAPPHRSAHTVRLISQPYHLLLQSALYLHVSHRLIQHRHQ